MDQLQAEMVIVFGLFVLVLAYLNYQINLIHEKLEALANDLHHFAREKGVKIPYLTRPRYIEPPPPPPPIAGAQT